MKLFTNCNTCKQQVSIKSNASDRSELIKEKGEEFNIQCNDCSTTHSVHVNNVRAKMNKKILIGGIIISLIVTMFLLNFVGLIGTISLTIPAIIWKQQSSAVHSFNTYMIRRT